MIMRVANAPRPHYPDLRWRKQPAIKKRKSATHFIPALSSSTPPDAISFYTEKSPTSLPHTQDVI